MCRGGMEYDYEVNGINWGIIEETRGLMGK